VILPDVNLLIHAINRNSPFHERARGWWNGAGSAGEVALGWPALVGFLRLSTNRRVLVNPLPVEKATETVDTWLSRARGRVGGGVLRRRGLHPERIAASPGEPAGPAADQKRSFRKKLSAA